MRRRGGPAAGAVLAVGLVLACTTGADDAVPPRPAAGGDATAEVAGVDAFEQTVAGLDDGQQAVAAAGGRILRHLWVAAPGPPGARDGLGPVFNAPSCGSCHERNGRARPPEATGDAAAGLLVRVSVPDDDGAPQPHPDLGAQLQDRAVEGVPAEGTLRTTWTERPGRYPDGTPYSLAAPSYEVLGPDGTPVEGLLISPRIAPPIFGVGLLEAVPAEDVLERADPDDDDGDGISGRANLVPDPASPGAEVLGRFGWKAAVPTVADQVAGAFASDLGVTSPRRADQPCTRL